MFERLRSLLRLIFVWKISDQKPDEAGLNPPDCILMQAFGQEITYIDPTLILPGRANEEISNAMWRADHGTLVPILAQWEFGLTKAVEKGEYQIEQRLGSPKQYRNTREILEEAKKIMDQRGWKSAVIVAHPWHLVRCIWTAEKLGIVVVYDQVLTRELNRLTIAWNAGLPVPKNQEQTLSLWRWLPYEFLARLYFWYRGWI